MVSRFRRTLSFPEPPSPLEKSYHIRSISLPCRSHPLISQLNDEINDLKSWNLQSSERTISWLCHGLIQLKNIHDSFDDLLQLPKTQESLRRRSDWVEKLLEDFLLFVDVYDLFRATLVMIKEEHTSAQVAIRRRNESTQSSLISYIKNRKKIEKDMCKLVSTVKSIGRSSVLPDSLLTFNDDAELAAVLRDVNEVTVLFTTSMLNAISGSSVNSKSCIGTRTKLMLKKSEREERIQEFEQVESEKLRNLRKQGDQEMRSVLKKLRQLENCVVEIESESGKMFRSLINARVSLLNILTQ